MEFSIREAVTADYEGMCEVFEEIDACHREALPHIFQKPDRIARTREYISDIIACKDAALFVAEYKSQLIGLVHINVRETPDIPLMVPRRYAVISDLIVKKRFHRFGVGRSLVETAYQWALNKGLTEIELSVWEFNEGAIAFYERLGFTTASRMMWKSPGCV